MADPRIDVNLKPSSPVVNAGRFTFVEFWNRPVRIDSETGVMDVLHWDKDKGWRWERVQEVRV